MARFAVARAGLVEGDVAADEFGMGLVAAEVGQQPLHAMRERCAVARLPVIQVFATLGEGQGERHQGPQVIDMVGQRIALDEVDAPSVRSQVVADLLLESIPGVGDQCAVIQRDADQADTLQAMAVPVVGRGLALVIARYDLGARDAPHPVVDVVAGAGGEFLPDDAVGKDRRLQAGLVDGLTARPVHCGPSAEIVAGLGRIAPLAGQGIGHGQRLDLAHVAQARFGVCLGGVAFQSAGGAQHSDGVRGIVQCRVGQTQLRGSRVAVGPELAPLLLGRPKALHCGGRCAWRKREDSDGEAGSQPGERHGRHFLRL